MGTLHALPAAGYVHIPQAVPAGIFQDWNNRLDAMLDSAAHGTEALRPYTVFEPATDDHPGPTVRCIDDLLGADAAWWEFFTSPLFRSLLTDTLGPDVVYLASQCVVKPAAVGSRVGWHRDHPSRCWTLTAGPGVRLLVLFDDADAGNGALQVLAGSHRPDHWSRDLPAGEAIGHPNADLRTVAGAAGDVIVLHPEVLHGSAANASGRRRRMVTTCWAHASDTMVDHVGFAGFGRPLAV